MYLDRLAGQSLQSAKLDQNLNYKLCLEFITSFAKKSAQNSLSNEL